MSLFYPDSLSAVCFSCRVYGGNPILTYVVRTQAKRWYLHSAKCAVYNSSNLTTARRISAGYWILSSSTLT